MEYSAEVIFSSEGFCDYEITKPESVYTDRAIVSVKAKKIFLLTTFDAGEAPEDYQQYIKGLSDDEMELSINYIPVFFGCDYDDVVRLMDDFAKKIREDYQ